jgi:hypothetical protein
MLLLPSQDRALWRHRHHGELGVGRVSPGRGRPRFARRVDISNIHEGRGFMLRRHGRGLGCAVELDRRWGTGGHGLLIR